MKKVILLVSNNFPASHERCGEPTDFDSKLLKQKIHTIRENADYYRKKIKMVNSGEAVLYIRRWTGRPYRSKPKDIMRLTKIGVQTISMQWSVSEAIPTIHIDGKQFFDLKTLANNDGLGQSDFLSWFFSKKNDFQGVILQFTNLMY